MLSRSPQILRKLLKRLRKSLEETFFKAKHRIVLDKEVTRGPNPIIKRDILNGALRSRRSCR
jgi:hypothetical protein